MITLNSKKEPTALRLSRDLKVNKNTAGRMIMKIRQAMNRIEHRKILQGVVNVDETNIGGKARKGTHGDEEGGEPGV